MTRFDKDGKVIDKGMVTRDGEKVNINTSGHKESEGSNSSWSEGIVYENNPSLHP